MNERRIDPRQRVLKAGKIVYNNASSVYDCTVRNVSKSGACLMLKGALTVPAEFELRMEDGRHNCIVSWRRADRIGVKFQ